MTVKNVLTLTCVSITLALTACSSDSDSDTDEMTQISDTDSINGTDDTTATSGTNDTTTMSASSALEGFWENDCALDMELAELTEIEVYRKVVVNFSGGTTGNFSSTFSAHESAICAEPAIADDSGTITGTYIVGDEVTSNDGLLVTELDLMRDAITPLGQETISPVVDQPLALGIFLINEQNLYFGVIDDPDATPPVRATAIDFDKPFTRQ